MKNRILSVLLSVMMVFGLLAAPVQTQAATGNPRITIQNKQFVVDGQRIWINGANTPWNNWNDFGGNFNATWWDTHFQQLRNAGVNATRVWINCNGDGSLTIGSNGMVTGASSKHWSDLEKFFEIAQKNQIYIMATLLSFDHFNSANTNYSRYRTMISSSSTIDSFVNNYTIPFVQKFGSNPYLWSIDLMNEPDWIFEDSACGNLPWSSISNYIARNAAAIHKNSSVLVTVGFASIKYNADGAGYEGNKASDSFLKSIYNDAQAKLDFYSPHYYDWVGTWYGVPFYVTPSGAKPNGWGLDSSKPSILGECPAVGSSGKTLTQDYESAYLKGWQGTMAWTSNRVDNCGGFEELSVATKYMLAKYPNEIAPSSASSNYTHIEITLAADYSNTVVTTLVSKGAELPLFTINADGSLNALNPHWSQFDRNDGNVLKLKAEPNGATSVKFDIMGNIGSNYWVSLGTATLDLTKTSGNVLKAKLNYSQSQGYYFSY